MNDIYVLYGTFCSREISIDRKKYKNNNLNVRIQRIIVIYFGLSFDMCSRFSLIYLSLNLSDRSERLKIYNSS